jgi:uncharacterized damage-inducible protein DinB
MNPALTLEELLGWNGEERAKWFAWLKKHPGALLTPIQPGGRVPNVASLIDHIFLVEVRHTQRLQGKDLPTATGVAAGDIVALFAYAARGREAVHRYLPTLNPADLNKPRDVVVASGTYPLSPRKLLFHMALHEVRHWAQIAAAVRIAGFTPPGDHDLFYSKSIA